MESTKRIKILTPGHISVLGGIYGPILTPYNEKESVIFKLVAAGIKVVEVLENGKEVTISVSNFKTDNSEPSKTANKKEEKKKNEPVVETHVEEPAEEEMVEDSTVTKFIIDEEDHVEEGKTEVEIVEDPVEDRINNNQNYNKHNKNNKKR